MLTPDSLLIIEPGSPPVRRRGRPKSAVESTALTTWVPTTYHDKLIKMANERHMSVSKLVKQILVLKIEKIGR
jgi:hypothetical protein